MYFCAAAKTDAMAWTVDTSPDSLCSCRILKKKGLSRILQIKHLNFTFQVSLVKIDNEGHGFKEFSI